MLLRTVLCLGLALGVVTGLDNGVARKPPLGWLSWQRYRCNMDCKNDPDNVRSLFFPLRLTLLVPCRSAAPSSHSQPCRAQCFSEKLIKKIIDEMVEGGYKDLGYEYVNLGAHQPFPPSLLRKGSDVRPHRHLQTTAGRRRSGSMATSSRTPRTSRAASRPSPRTPTARG